MNLFLFFGLTISLACLFTILWLVLRGGPIFILSKPASPPKFPLILFFSIYEFAEVMHYACARTRDDEDFLFTIKKGSLKYGMDYHITEDDFFRLIDLYFKS